MRFDSDILASGTITAPSGIFDTLTVSGVPVDIGGGGGSGTITDINTTATGPSVTITGVGGVSTITEGNVITISGNGFSPGFRGALLTTSTGIDFPNGATITVPWNTEAYDTDGFHSEAVSQRLTIPVGINKVQVSTAIRWEDSSASDADGTARTIGLIHFDSTDTLVARYSLVTGPAIGSTLGSERTAQSAISPVVDVNPGDYFVVIARQQSGATLALETIAPYNFFALEVKDPVPLPAVAANIPFRGALVSTTSGISVTHNGLPEHPWDIVVYDTDGFFTNSISDSYFTIPPGITKAQFSVGIQWDDDTQNDGTERLIVVDGYDTPGGSIVSRPIFVREPTMNGATTNDFTQMVVSGPVPVTPGVHYRVRLRQTSGVTLATVPPASPAFYHHYHFGIQVLEDDTAVSLKEFTAASGTFTDSLTVSGVPVSTGTGGGSGTITDINTTATGPSVTITGTGGISTITDGNTITVSGGAFSPGFRGAYVTISTGTTIPDNENVIVPWDTVGYDTDGFFDTDERVFVIPEGINKVRVSSFLRWDFDSEPEERSMFISHVLADQSGTPTRGADRRQAPNSASNPDTRMGCQTAILNVSPGDKFRVAARQDTTGSITLSLGDSGPWFQLEVIDPAPLPGPNLTGKEQFRGALVTTTSGLSIPNGWTRIEHPWDQILYDTEGFLGQRNSRFVIPAGVTRIRMHASVFWDDDESLAADGTERGIDIAEYTDVDATSFVNLVGFDTRPGVNTGSTQPSVQPISTPVISTAPGRAYAVNVRQNSSVNPFPTDANSNFPHLNHFAIEVVEDNEPVTLHEVTAVSGTFEESLTVSGVPVSTGTGVSDPLIINELVAVTGTFTDGITVGSSTVRIFPSGVETPQLILAGQEVTALGLSAPSISGTGLSYFVPDAPPASGTTVNDEFDSNPFQELSVSNGVPLDSRWTEFDVDGIVDGTNNLYGIFADGFHLAGISAPPADNTIVGYYQDIPAMDSWQFVTKVGYSLATNQVDDIVRIGLFVADDTIVSSPSTADLVTCSFKLFSTTKYGFAYEEWSDYTTPTTNNIVQHTVDVSLGVNEDNIAIPDGVYLKIGWRASDNRIDVGYSYDGLSFTDLAAAVTTHPLSNPPTKIGIFEAVGTNERPTGHFQFFRMNDHDSFFRDNPVYGRRVSVSGTSGGLDTASDQSITGSWDFGNSLTVSGVPVATGTEAFVLKHEFSDSSIGSVTFDLPNTGARVLEIDISARTTTNTAFNSIVMRFNGDTGTNYTFQRVVEREDGTRNLTYTNGSTFVAAGDIPAAQGDTGAFGSFSGKIPNYPSSTSYKSFSGLGYAFNSDGAAVGSKSRRISEHGIWESTAPITSITFSVTDEFAAGSTITLRGY